MALTNYERVGKVLETLRNVLQPYVLRELKSAFPGEWKQAAREYYSGGSGSVGDSITVDPEKWDAAAVLNIMIRGWNDVFRKVLGQSERTLIFELRDARNNWAHQQQFSTDDAYRVFDNVERLFNAISAPEAEEVRTQKEEILRQRYEKRARKVIVKVKNEPQKGLKGWREVIDPHPDVASGKFNQAEFAADLWQVFKGKGSREYRDPREFFRRTYITEGIRNLLTAGVDRLSGEGGDPVIELQTNFGGGKTHSMLALYHLFSDVSLGELSGIEAVVEGDTDRVPRDVNKAVLVGNKLQAAKPRTMEDGTILNTLWGELAYQLGGREGYDMVKEADQSGTNPGDALTELFNRFAPCLILIDEWVAYARELYTKSDLPAGTFDSQFTFAQTLSESARNAERTFLVVSVPASDNEIGGEGGKEALNRLKNAIGRVQSPWQPADRDESFEIVRRRLFQDIRDHKAQDAVVKAFANLYESQSQDLPQEVREVDYERRLSSAYPIHPELFDQLYGTWSTIDRFQRTRGVLRLMAAIINSLWERSDSGALIMPSSVPLDDPDVRTELTKFLPSHWVPIIQRDVDGEESLPRSVDRENIKLDRISATRRVARTIFMATAPLAGAAHHGIDQRKVILGCIQPGEQSADFGDALRRLSGRATYLYVQSGNYWYGDQPTVRRLADDRASQIQSKPDDVHGEIVRRLRDEVKKDKGGFARIHVCPSSSNDVVDDHELALAILPPEYVHLAKEADTDALKFARTLLETRGNTPRSYRNTVVFLGPDKTRLQELEKAVAYYLAWVTIVDDAKEARLELPQSQIRQAEDQRNSASTTVDSRIPETYMWLIQPTQANPTGPIELTPQRVSGGASLAERVTKKLRNDDALLTGMIGARLRLEMDRIPLWRGDHVSISQLQEDFAKYPYLPRLPNPETLVEAVVDGVASLTSDDAFGYADSYDDTRKRYVGLKLGEQLSTAPSPAGLIVKPDVAQEQQDAEAQKKDEGGASGGATGGGTSVPGGAGVRGGGETPLGEGSKGRAPGGVAESPRKTTRFFATKTLKPTSPGTEAGKISEEVIQHLAELVGSEITVTLEIQAHVPEGIPDEKMRVIKENCDALKFQQHGFEEE